MLEFVSSTVGLINIAANPALSRVGGPIMSHVNFEFPFCNGSPIKLLYFAGLIYIIYSFHIPNHF